VLEADQCLDLQGVLRLAPSGLAVAFVVGACLRQQHPFWVRVVGEPSAPSLAEQLWEVVRLSFVALHAQPYERLTLGTSTEKYKGQTGASERIETTQSQASSAA
jgi:hypothetical protein